MMPRFARFPLALSGAVLAAFIIPRILAACGPYWTDLRTVETIAPPHMAAFARGELGVVRPRFARRYLAQAYRVLGGGPPLGPAALPVPVPNAPAATPTKTPLEQWNDAVERALPPGPGAAAARLGLEDADRKVADADPGADPDRSFGEFEFILNCPSDAFSTAVKTLANRTVTFGAGSPALRNWIDGQTAVFRNCKGPALALPRPAPAGAPALLRADRAYQTAAAYFYGMRYEEAERRFRAIAADQASPWHVYGRYLAARALIRRTTVTETNSLDVDELQEQAEADLRAVAADPALEPVRASALGLLNYLAARTDPMARLHALSAVLASPAQPSRQDMSDFVTLADRFLGDTVDYDYAAVERADDLVRDDLFDWILAMQGRGEPAAQRAVEQWTRTKSPRWLVAALWKLPAAHPRAAELLRVAGDITPDSPAFATVAFLRVHHLARLGRHDEARSLLAALPRAAAPGFPPETVNLLNAERMMLATSFDDLLASAPRAIVTEQLWANELDADLVKQPRQFSGPAFDDDAAEVFTYRLPLERIAAAAASRSLPTRLRVRVAAATLTRAILLGRDDVGIAAARTLSELAPAMKVDADAYVTATASEDRHRAGVLLLLRTPGMHVFVRGLETDHEYDKAEPARVFDHQGTYDTPTANWWYALKLPVAESEPHSMDGRPTRVVELLYPDGIVPYPAFLSAAERAAAEEERQAIARLGTARWYLMNEALSWAKATPKDERVAEALALSIEGWRWARGDEDADLPQRAFQLLHKQYASSEWARKTRYWYR